MQPRRRRETPRTRGPSSGVADQGASKASPLVLLSEPCSNVFPLLCVASKSLCPPILLARSPYPLRGGKHQRDGIHVLGLHLAGRNTQVRKVFQLEQQVHECHGVDKPRRYQGRTFVNLDSRLSNDLDDVLNHLVRLLCHRLILSYDPVLSSGCSFSNFSRVAERAAFPAVLFTIHFGGFRRMVRTATPLLATTRLRISRSTEAAFSRSSSCSTSATTTISSVPRSGLYRPIAIARPS